MKRLSNQRGALPVLALILAAVVLVVFGIAVYNASKSHQEVASTNRSPSSSASPGTTANPAATASNVLGVGDWGIRIRLEGSLANTKVIYNKQQTSDQPSQSYYAFTTSRVEALGGNCANTTLQFGDIVILNRFSSKPVATPDGELINNTPIDGYYYVLTAPSASCSGKGVKPESIIEAQDRAALKLSLKTLPAVSN